MATRIDLRADAAIARQAAYPDTGEQLDALWKIVDALINRQPLPAEALAVRDAIATVKARYPKPTQESK